MHALLKEANTPKTYADPVKKNIDTLKVKPGISVSDNPAQSSSNMTSGSPRKKTNTVKTPQTEVKFKPPTKSDNGGGGSSPSVPNRTEKPKPSTADKLIKSLNKNTKNVERSAKKNHVSPNL